jgi:hypothetical protein
MGECFHVWSLVRKKTIVFLIMMVPEMMGGIRDDKGTISVVLQTFG